MEKDDVINEEYEIIFESANINYVKLSEKLIHDYLVMVNDPVVANKISHNIQIYTYEQELKWLKSKLEKNALCYSMLEKRTGEYIGNIEIMGIRNKIGELGICITSAKQDKHYGTEAIEAFLKYAYKEFHLDGMELNVYATNLRAIHCYEKIGFIRDREGKTEQDIHMKLVR